jgi:hypothetical protein
MNIGHFGLREMLNVHLNEIALQKPGSMYKKILLLLTFFAAVSFKATAQPPNDNCTFATVINTTPFGVACSASISASTVTATNSLPGTNCVALPDDDLWYQFTANTSSIIFRYSNARNIVTGGQTSPSFALYQGACPSTATTFFCQAVTTSGDGFRIVSGLTPGVTYYLRLWSLSTGIGMAIDFCIQDVPGPPSNDNCGGATPVATLPPGSTCTSPTVASTVGSTMSVPGPSCSSTSHNDDIWYSFVANTTAVSIQFSNARMATTNGNANLGYAVYGEACPGTNTNLFCNGNLGGNSGSVTVPGLAPGQTYYIRFFSLGDNNYMTFNFCLVDVIVASNDECSTAVAIRTYGYDEIAIPANVSTAGGTRSANDPDCAGGENNDDVWYRFDVSTSTILLKLKNVIINETGGGGTAGYALYAGCPTSSATVSCNTIASAGSGEHIINGLTPGTDYYLRIWSTLTGGNTVSLDLTVLRVTPAPNDECVNAIAVTLQSGDSTCGSTIHASTVGATRSTPDPSCTNYNDEDIWYTFVAGANAVRINFSNAHAAGSATGNANVGFALHEISCPGTAPAIACVANMGSGNGTQLIAGLVPGRTYYLRFFSYDVNNYAEFDFCINNSILPDNDECANATSIPIGTGFCTSPVIGTLRNATASAGFSEPACALSSTVYDVWFSARIPSSGNLIIQTSPINNLATEDLVMEAWIGDCNSLTRIACDDDGNPEPSPASLHPRISLTGRNSGEQIYLRVMKKYPLSYNEFAICAWDSTVLIPVAAGGNCVPGEPDTINSTSGNNYMWVPVYDGSKHIIAEINARGSNLDIVNTSLFVNTSGSVRSHNSHFYLDRNLSIEPQTPGGARIRLYMRNNELLSLMAADGSIAGLEDLKVNKTAAACGPAFAGQSTVVLQDTSGGYGTDHFIEFSINSFSTFFVDGGISALPLEFVSFNAEKQNGKIVLNWTVVQDATIAIFEIQRSHDGISFVPAGEKNPRDHLSGINGNWQYVFTDATPAPGTVFYRIKMKDVNGKQVYSKVAAVTADATNARTPRVYPNPVSRYLVIQMPASMPVASISLFNGAGTAVKQLRRQSIPNGVYTMDLQNQPAGVYLLQVSDGQQNYRFKVIKL